MPEPTNDPTVIQIVGYKNTGKTTVVCRLTELLKQGGYTVATMKHDAHDFEMDKEGTDTWRHQQAGADLTIITSPHQTAILQKRETPLEQLIQAWGHVDFVLVEGFKTANYPKFILVKSEQDIDLVRTLHKPIAIIAWPDMLDAVSARQQSFRAKQPVFALNDIEPMYRLIQQAHSRRLALD
ncbi:molybdopterin-guanine dinucleotide biosynthesis protein B [Paenibacillus curdlanolyticus YK9]|uniref:Molybdopterin-guanine dinucleotide biosynthesis protein B n=1 Tax=Paenibacillus curdlanolyticus YK9 TaxID=717606 RepID=E0I6Y2_9BACL|nr:molybdopterin-guanine dinucleotide biosynthesis protein B [Paenibacillus curdlanolyticus]EFM11798.1 molybdopterin-guanine dinucleotide biosynthesis protein B [Paenibacillus curdlanolyticus YK9]